MGDASFPVVEIIPVFILLVVVVVTLVRHHGARQAQAHGVLWLQALRTLITHVQRHRGLSAGVLAGDHSLQQRLTDTQLQVSRDFAQIGAVGEWIKHSSSWQGITQHWARLAGNVYQLNVSRAMDQHNRLIKNILVLVDDIALAHHLNSGPAFKSNIWRDLLTLAEYIGQARAIGTVIAAKGHDWSDNDYVKARLNLQKVDQEIVATLETPRCRTGLDAQNLQHVLDFLTYIDGQILREGPLVSAPEFYLEASKTLDRIYEKFDHELTRVTRRLAR